MNGAGHIRLRQTPRDVFLDIIEKIPWFLCSPLGHRYESRQKKNNSLFPITSKPKRVKELARKFNLHPAVHSQIVYINSGVYSIHLEEA